MNSCGNGRSRLGSLLCFRDLTKTGSSFFAGEPFFQFFFFFRFSYYLWVSLSFGWWGRGC